MLGHYLMFNRNCEEALKAYEKAFDTKAAHIQKYGDMPPNPAFPIEENDLNLILHSRLVIEGVEVMCADSRQTPEAGSNMYISLTTSNDELVKRAWDTLKDGGKVSMELTPSFFARLHGNLQDKFGVNWMFTLE
jgi:PhnB protein